MRSTLSIFAFLLWIAAWAQPVTEGSKFDPELDVPEFKAAMEDPGVQLIDVRTSREFSTGHIPGSINVDWTAPDFETTFTRLDRERPVLLYCAMGGRSDQAREFLEGKGYNAQHLEGGIGAWKEAGMPIVK